MKYVSLLIILFSCAHTPSKLSFDKELTRYKYPFDVKYLDLKSQNERLKMAYMDLNPQYSKTIVLSVIYRLY